MQYLCVLHVLYYIINFVINSADIYVSWTNRFLNAFAIIQLLSHINVTSVLTLRLLIKVESLLLAYYYNSLLKLCAKSSYRDSNIISMSQSSVFLVSFFVAVQINHFLIFNF